MLTSPPVPPPTPSTVWLARGRHTGPTAPDVLRKYLQSLKDDATILDFKELSGADTATGESAFEARWVLPDDVTVRARLTLAEWSGRGQEWTLVAEAERPWDLRWPSPAEMFWPWDADAPWGQETVTGQRYLDINPLPDDDKDVKRTLRGALRDTWTVHVLVHEAMTPDERGRRSLVPLLPPGLHHRVVEHRAAPHQLRTVNWALRDAGVELPRGGALVLPGSPAPAGYDGADFSVRNMFLDGTHPAELLDAIRRFVDLSRPLPDGGEVALTALREQWQLLTLEEELARERQLVAMYSEALEAMTQSRDLYREAAEQAHEALAAYREAAAAGERPQPQARATGSPFQQLGRTLERFKVTAMSLRPLPAPRSTPTGQHERDEEAGLTTETTSQALREPSEAGARDGVNEGVQRHAPELAPAKDAPAEQQAADR
ncbi:hypothetical protein ABZ330_27125 [Streptomyces sp. NPDC006172]|uniref:hypothetical protein n=1 Tax=Streptomyces sp. NPDC006172 TaxID=3154470 RepID=UPI0033E91369